MSSFMNIACLILFPSLSLSLFLTLLNGLDTTTFLVRTCSGGEVVPTRSYQRKHNHKLLFSRHFYSFSLGLRGSMRHYLESGPMFDTRGWSNEYTVNKIPVFRGVARPGATSLHLESQSYIFEGLAETSNVSHFL